MKRGPFKVQELVTHAFGPQRAFASTATGDVSREAAARPRRPRRVAKLAGLAMAAAMTVPTGAVAGVGDIMNTEVSAASTNVTYSAGLATTEPLRTYVGYTFKTTYSGTTNTTNFVFLQGLVYTTDRSQLVQFDAVNSDPRCSATVIQNAGFPTTQFTCQVARQFRPGAAPVSFDVFFVAPEKNVNGDADDTSTAVGDEDYVVLDGNTFYAEGTKDTTTSNDSVAWVGPMNSAGYGPVPTVLLGTFNPTNVKSAVPKGGVKLFTGDRGEPVVDLSLVPPRNDPFATKVDVPAGSGYSTAEVTESDPVVQGVDGCNSLSSCFDSALTIPGAFSPYLGVYLRQDATTLPSNLKLGTLIINYTSDVSLVTTPLTLASNTCSRDSKGNPVPSTVTDSGGEPIPCIAECKIFKKTRDRNDKEWTANLAGDLQCWLINTKNGTFRLR